MRLSQKIITLVVSVSLLIGLGSLQWGTGLMERAFNQELSERSEYIATTLAEAYATALVNQERMVVMEGIQRLVREHEDVSYIYFVGFDGKISIHSFNEGVPVALATLWDNLPKEQTMLQFTDSSSRESFIESRRPLIRGLSAYVHVGMNQTFMKEQVATLRQSVVSITLLITLAGIVFSIILAHQFAKPIHLLSALMRRFGQGETISLKAQDFKAGGRELVTLVDSFTKMQQERLVNEEKLHQAGIVFDNTVEGILITDKEGIILNVNEAFCEITGYSEEEAIGATPALLKSGHHDDNFFASFWKQLHEEGEWKGEIWNRRKNGDVYPNWETITTVRDSEGEIVNFICIFSDITNQKDTERRIRHLADHDALTELPNRRLFNERVDHSLERAKRSGNRVALMFLDLDRFKQINDSLGHSVGDGLIKTVACQLQGLVRESDTVARLGGDEFTILMEDVDSAHDAAVLAQKVIESCAKPYKVHTYDLHVTVSVGISMYPDNGDDFDTLLRNADAAMYRAKESGRNNYQFYTAELTDIAYEQMVLESNLRRALELNELELHYQPQVLVDDNKVVGVEALLRWQNAELGMVSPAKFIPLAEETGLIVPIGEWVIHTACQQAKRWMDEGTDFGTMSVNISAVQLHRGELLQTVSNALNETGLPHHKLELEVTESSLMYDTEAAIELLMALQELGVRLAIDDFGTGYSSLSYLKRLPLHKLKVDQSFVRDISHDEDDESIVRAVIALAKSLGLDVIAEGVETETQKLQLLAMGCHQAQGYLYSRPLPLEEVSVWLSTHH